MRWSPPPQFWVHECVGQGETPLPIYVSVFQKYLKLIYCQVSGYALSESSVKLRYLSETFSTGVISI
jgi:hypothetical protein